MRRISLAMLSTVAALVLLFSYRTSRGPGDRSTGVVGAAPAGIASAAIATPEAIATPAVSPSASAAGPDPRASARSAGNGTVVVNGIVAETFQGPVQLQVTISNGRIVDVVVLVRPTGGTTHDEVNIPALPVLRAQALAAQSARIDGVSGATATSEGYRASLQSALDAVNFG